MASAGACTREWQTESYTEQSTKVWPEEGRHILAQFDDDSVVVYQAYCPEIAEYAVKHQKFGGDKFSYSRMSWIKTNFLWMMYRSRWATNTRQERILAVRITREGFDTILSKALTGKAEKERGMESKAEVRLQWDPDHHPSGSPEKRRAIQLGLRDKILHSYGNDWIVEIKDITRFVNEQYEHIKKNEFDKLIVAKERVYPVTDVSTVAQIGLDSLLDK